MADLSTERVSFESALAALLAGYEVGSGSGTILDSRLTLINYAKVKLDEIIPEGEGVQFNVDGDINISDPLNLMLNSLLDESARRVQLNCPIEFLDPVKSSESAGVANATDSLIGYVPLADNFVRLVSFKMSEWKRPVSIALKSTDPAYKKQTNKYTRGGINKPVAAFSHRTISATQKRVLEYFSIVSSHAIDWLYYIQETAAEDLQDNLVDALTWNIAGTVLEITERPDLAKLAFEQELLSYKNLV